MKNVVLALCSIFTLYTVGQGQIILQPGSQSAEYSSVPIREHIKPFNKIAMFSSKLSAQQYYPALKVRWRYYIGGAAGLLNWYKRGNLDQYWKHVLQDPDAVPDAGSPSFFDLQAGVLASFNQGKDWLGPKIRLMVPVEHAIWGQNYDYGSRNEIYFSGMIFGGMLTYHHAMNPTRSIFLVVEPGLDFMTMSGYLFTVSDERQFKNGYGFGEHLSLGADYLVGSIFGMTFRIGYRFLETDARYVDETTNAGYTQPHIAGAGSDLLKVDWSGPYTQFGLIILL